MDVRIGITQSAKELEIELADGEHDALLGSLDDTLTNGEGVLTLTDKRGRRILVPVAKVAYVEIGVVSTDRRVGFAR